MMTVPSAPADLGATAYDELADRYDRIPVENRINRLMRRASLARIVSTFPPGSRILEVGCGTGDEALALAARGVQVVAIDASREMIRVARAKADRRGMDGHVEFREGHARDLPSLRDSLGAPFDGGYASFSLAWSSSSWPLAPDTPPSRAVVYPRSMGTRWVRTSFRSGRTPPAHSRGRCPHTSRWNASRRCPPWCRPHT